MRTHVVTNNSVCTFCLSANETRHRAVTSRAVLHHEASLQQNLVPSALQEGPVPARTCSPSAEEGCAVFAGAAVGAEQKGGSSLAAAAPRFAFQVSMEHSAL